MTAAASRGAVSDERAAARPLRVLFVEVAYGGLGADYSVHAQLTETFDASGEINVMSLSHPGLIAVRPDDRHRVMCKAFERQGGRLRRRLSIAFDLPRALRDVLPIVREFDPDVVYSSQLRRDCFAAFTLGKLLRKPLIVHLHYVYGPWLGRVAYRTIRNAHHIVAISEFVRETALLRGIDADKVSVVPNLTAAHPVVDRDRAQVRASLGIADDDVVVIGVGRLDRGKGFVELIDAARDLGDVPRLRVLICGSSNHDPGHDRQLHDRVRDLGLDSVITFLGQVPAVSPLMAAADVFCLPSVMEPFGLVFIEAMATGLPVVALRSGGVPEIVVDEVTGLLSYPGDHDQLVANLRRVLGDPALRARLGEAGRERLATAFDHDTIARRWLAVLTRSLRV